MITNWLKTALRNLFRNKTFSLLNIFGLAIGIACASLIFLWVEDEHSYDKMYPKKDLLYNVVVQYPMDGKIYTFQHNSTPKVLGPALKKEVPAIDNTCRLSWESNQLFSYNDKRLDQQGYYADSSVFSMFDLELVEGNVSTALKEINDVVISERMSQRMFGNSNNVVGKILKIDNRENVRVTGVFKDLPVNSTIQFEWLGSFNKFLAENVDMSDWGSYSINTYVQLKPGVNVNTINAQLKDFIRKKDGDKAGMPELLSMNDWRLRSSYEEGKRSGGRIEYVKMFSLIAIIILLIACINFMNIATAKSEKRAKEVGVRKVIGASKKLIVMQFMGEALLLSAIAVVLSVIIVLLTLPQFSLLVEKQISIGLDKPAHIAFLLAITLICGLVAGSYPSLYLSSFNPVVVLKSMKMGIGSAAIIRKGLVILQFSISIILIISTVVIYRQIQHIKNRDLGYDKEHLLTIPVRGDILKHFEALKADMLKTGSVQNVATSTFKTIDFGNNTTQFMWQGKDPNAQILVSWREVSPGFLATTGMQLKSGRDFKTFETDSSHVVITESLEKLMNVDNAVGKYISSPGQSPDSPQKRFEIVGVIKDYVYGDMYGKSEPVIFFCYIATGKELYVKLNKNVSAKNALASIESVMMKHNPGYPFSYRFVDDHFNEQFRTEQLTSKLAKVFAVLAVLISCLGLFGLSVYTAERRKREIGIRKVLGAETHKIAALLTKEFLVLIAISCAIGFPVAWWMMDSWIKGYAYRTDISVGTFLLSAGLLIIISMLTVSMQAIKAAIANPVKSLRTE